MKVANILFIRKYFINLHNNQEAAASKFIKFIRLWVVKNFPKMR